MDSGARRNVGGVGACYGGWLRSEFKIPAFAGMTVGGE